MLELTEEGMRSMQQAGGQAVNAQFKKEGRLMHNREWQKEMARRSMARPDALETRSRGGKTASQKRHKDRIVRVEDRYLWYVNGNAFMCTFGFDNSGDLLRALNEARPTPPQRVSPLISGYRKKLYGWSCKKLDNNSHEELNNASDSSEEFEQDV